jgi:hypothetical protein
MAAGLTDAEVFGTTAPPAAPRGMSDAEVFGTGLEGFPEEAFQADYARHPITIPVPAAVTDLAAYREPGTDLTDIEPRGAPSRILDAASQGFRTGMAGRTDPEALAAQAEFNRGSPLNTWIVTPGMRLAGGVMGAAGGAFGQGAYELGNLWSPEAGRDAFMAGQVIPNLGMAIPKLPGPRAMAEAPRVSPMMEGFDKAGAPARFVSERTAPDVSQLDTRNAIQALIEHDMAENPPAAPDRGANLGLTAKPEVLPSPAEPPAAPAAPAAAPETPSAAATVTWRSANHDFPGLTATGEEQTHTDGRVYAQVRQPDGTVSYVPKDELVMSPTGTQSVGAAASREGTDPAVLAAKTPAQALNDFRTSVTQTVRDRAQPGAKEGTVEDHTVYVPGVTRLESARVFDPDVVGNHDVMKDIDKTYETAANAIEQRNHDILKSKAEEMAGNINTVEALRETRKSVSPEALGVFKNEQPVSGQPVLDIINEIRDSPAGKSEAVTNTLNRIEKSLYDKNGNLEVLPSQYYGARRNLMEIRDSGPMTKEGAEARTARREIGRVGEVMDRVIGEGSNGYKDVYLPQWAHYSRLIDQQEYLQSKMIGPGKITGPNGNLTANGVQKLLEQVAIDKGKSGNSRAKTLTEDQLNSWIAIRNELAAMQYRDQLSASHGSPTVKKAAAAARLGVNIAGLSPEAQDAAIHLALLKTTGGTGNAIYQFIAKPLMQSRRERAADAIMEGTRNKLLRTEIPSE